MPPVAPQSSWGDPARPGSPPRPPPGPCEPWSAVLDLGGGPGPRGPRGPRAPPGRWWSFSREAADAAFVGEVGSAAGCSFPGWPVEVRRCRASALGLHGENAPAPAAGVSASCAPVSLSRRSPAPAPGLGEELLHIAVCLSLINRGNSSLMSVLLPFRVSFRE